jgi:hypothetical protein
LFEIERERLDRIVQRRGVTTERINLGFCESGPTIAATEPARLGGRRSEFLAVLMLAFRTSHDRPLASWGG